MIRKDYSCDCLDCLLKSDQPEEIANMTRKDYIAIASAFWAAQPVVYESADKHAQYALDVRCIARALAADNPRFDYDRFCEAAGLVQEGPGNGYISVRNS